MIRNILILILFLSASNGFAKDTIVRGLSSKNISINTTFTGSDILLFGSIKRANNEQLIPSNIIIEVLGPKSDIIVRKKKKMFGIWVNSDPHKILNSLSFYSILYTKKPENILSANELVKASLGRDKFLKSNNLEQSYLDAVKANVRIKSKSGFYLFNNDPIILKDETLFSTQISLPANLIAGDYETKIYLVQNGKIIDSSKDIIKVRKIGLEDWLYKTAHDQSLFYGVFSIILALFFGWGASTLFRRFQK